MYKILNSDGAVLYDINDPNTRPVTEAKGTFEIGQPGSLQFSLVPQHPLYDDVTIMETYVNALKESSEIFYGRVIDINVDKITGIKRIECAGALSFLSDGELPPVTDPTDASKGVELTAGAFFTRCIEAYNAEIGNDPKRALSVGTISHSKAQETKTYHMTGYTQIKSALESNLINEYGGYFRVRKDGNAHLIDWLDTYTEPNTSPIELRRNIRNQENAIAPGDFFTMIRPSGKNNLVLDPIPVSQELVNKYGRIIKSVSFKEAETEEGLRSDVENYLADLAKGAGKTSTIRLVDLHFLDDSIPTIHMGSTYTNIAGFEEEPMVIAGMELNFSNPAEDSITAKNAKDLEAGKKGVASSKGSLAKETSGSRGFQNIWQHITETKDELRMAAERIEINAQNLTEVIGTFERYAEETTETIEFQGTKITAMQGTGVLQNSDQITQVAGLFSSKYYLVPAAARTGRNPSSAGWFEAQQYLVSENDINSGIELYSSVNAALAGNAINTTSGLTPYIGQWVTRMVHTSDTTPTAGKNYYTKSLGLLDGASFMITEEGVETNVGELLKETSEGVGENERQIALIQGSALWVYRDQITGVAGEYEIVTAADGTKTLVIKSGGGLKIRRNNTEYGIYDEDSLTGGIIVSKLNDNSVTTSIRGDHVDLSTNTAFGTISSTVGNHTTSINSLGQRVSTVEGSALWQSRNDITDVVGAFEYATVPGTGQRYLVVKDGGAFKLRRNNAEFGIYDEYSLTAGVIVDKVNGGTVTIRGSKILVGEAETDQTLKKWATESDGLFAQNIGALSARIGSIEADYITANDIDANFITTRLAQASRVSVVALNTSGAAIFGGGTYATNGLWVEGTRLTIGNGNFVQSVVGSSTTGGGYKFTVTQADGTSVDYPFNVASSITLSGAWTGASYTATAKDPDDNVLGSVTTAISRSWSGNTTLNIVSGSSTLLTETFTAGTGTGASTQGSQYTINTFNSSHRAYGYVDTTSHPAGRMVSFNVDATSEYNAGSTAGAAAVTLTAGSWQGGSKTVSASNGKSVTVSIPAIDIGEGGWTSHKKRVSAYSDAGDTGELAYLVVDATSEYNAGSSYGASSVTLTKGTWQGGSISITASNGKSESVSMPAVTMSSGAFSSHKKTVYAYSSAAGITGYIASHVVDATSEFEAGANGVTLSAGSWSSGKLTVTASNGNTQDVTIPAVSSTTWTNTTGRTWRADLTIGGVTRSSTTKDFNSYYTDGQSAGASGVTISAAGWSGGSNVVSASNGKSVTVSMPAVTMSSGAFSSHKKTVYAYSSAAGITGYIASHVVDATSEYTAGGTAAGVTSAWSGNTFTVTRAADTSTKSLSCIVTISPSSNKTLDFGESVTVKALGNASEKASVTITAPSRPAQRTVSSLSAITMASSDTTNRVSKSTTVTFSDGSTQTAYVYIYPWNTYKAGYDQGFIDRGPGRAVDSLSKITMTAEETGTDNSKSTTVTFVEGSTQEAWVYVDTSAVYTAGFNATRLSSVTVSNIVRTGNSYTVYVNIALDNGVRYNGHSAGSFTPS